MVLLLLRTLLSALARMSAFAPGQVDTEAGVLASLAAALSFEQPRVEILRGATYRRVGGSKIPRALSITARGLPSLMVRL